MSALAQQVAREGQSAASTEVVTEAVTRAVGDLDAVERRMAASAVMRALTQVFPP